jgi:predicted SprT family Zn-dependent metalloprotease
MRLETALQELAEEMLTTLMTACPIGYRPKILWKRQLRVSAGMAYMGRGEIGLSVHLITTPERLQSTLVHEYAHLVAFQRYGRKGLGHGKPWRDAMRELGAPPEVYHRYEVVRNRANNPVHYKCVKCGATFTRRKVIRNLSTVRHRACHGVIMRINPGGIS